VTTEMHTEIHTDMHREIHEQPEVISRLLSTAATHVNEIADIAAGCRHVLFVARGSSDHAALYGQYLVSTRTGMLATSASPSVMTLYKSELDLRDVLVVAVSQSGETTEIVETIAWSRQCGAKTIGITNRENSTLAQAVDAAIITHAGAELAVPATKTWSAQMVSMLILAAGLGARDLVTEAQAIPDEMHRLLSTDVSALVETLTDVQALMVTSRGYTAATALEIALKLKEACYISAQGASSADLEHGPLAVLGPDVPALIVAPTSGPSIAGLLAVARKAHEAGAPVLLLGGDGQLEETANVAAARIQVSEVIAPVVLGVPGQLLTEQLARARGINPDAPRGLSKVTQTSA
jgi:glutamine---fructose-6-phosphate transaminase (isomerizing)